MPIAPINMTPESGQEIAEQIKSSILGPLQQGQEYQSLLGQQPGLNIGPDMPKHVMGLMRALCLVDPSGLMGGPAGLVWGKAASPEWAGALRTYKNLGSSIESRFPRIAATTMQTPVNPMGELASVPGTLGHYIESSPLRPQGTINLYGPRDPWTTVHEMLHRLHETDPVARSVAHDMKLAAPVGTEKALTARGVTDPRSITPEYFAYALEDLLKGEMKASHPLADLVTTVSNIKAPPEMKERLIKFLKSTPKDKQEETLEAITGVFGKSKVSSTSSKLEQLYNDIVTFTTENNPIRSKIETSPFARAQFANELKTKITSFDDSPLKKKLMKDLIKINDPKDPKSALKLELLAQDVHLNTRMQAAKYESLLKAEFGEEDATKILDKLWGKVYEETGPVDLLKSERGSFSKSEPIGKQGVKEQKDALKNKEIMDVIREEIGRVIQKPGKGGVISSKKGGGMIVNRPDKLSEYLDEIPRPMSYDPITGERKWEF